MHQCDRCNNFFGDGPLLDETFLCNPCLKVALLEAEPGRVWGCCDDPQCSSCAGSGVFDPEEHCPICGQFIPCRCHEE